MENNNVIYGINGPVVTVKNTDSFEMMEMVHVGKQKLVGEIIGIPMTSQLSRFMRKQQDLSRVTRLRVPALR